jgi:hypothetical protein
MNNLIAIVKLSVVNYLDPIYALRQTASDMNTLLAGFDSQWMLLSANGDILSIASNPIDAINQVKFPIK